MYTISLFVLMFAVSAITAQIYSVENPDGSYSTGLRSNSRGQTANSVLALLTKSSGWTDPSRSTRQIENSYPFRGGFLQPHVEFLKLAEVFLKLKGEIVPMIYAVLNDNYDLIRSVYRTIVNKAGTLHNLTLNGVVVLRKILEVSSALVDQWQTSSFNDDTVEINSNSVANFSPNVQIG